MVTKTFTLHSEGIPGLKILSAQLDVVHGQNASVTVQTKSGIKSSMEVNYDSEPINDNSLGTQIADSYGYVKWEWKVPSDTTPGTWNVTITAG